SQHPARERPRSFRAIVPDRSCGIFRIPRGWYTLALSSTCGRSQPFPRQGFQVGDSRALWRQPRTVDGGVLMKRFARVACVVVASLIIAASNGSGRPPVGADESRFYAGLTLGPTFGHKSSGFVGIEAGATVQGPVAVFVEGGHMGNVGTADLDARAQTIANAV